MNTQSNNLGLFLLIIFLSISFSLHAQNDYIATDTSILQGVRVIDGGAFLNARICQVQIGKEIKRYSPNELAEYSIFEEQHYVSKLIEEGDSNRRYFLEKLVEGNTSLYFFRGKNQKRFFIENSAYGFVELLREDGKNKALQDYKEFLKLCCAECLKDPSSIDLLSFNREALKNFILKYNSCDEGIPVFQSFGAAFYYGFAKPVVNNGNENNYLKYADFANGIEIGAGIYYNKPIGQSRFSLHPELYYAQYSNSSYSKIADTAVDILLTIRLLRVPVLLRYKIPFRHVSPYFYCGGSYSFQHTENNRIFKTYVGTDHIDIEEIKEVPVLSNHLIGFSFGAGFQVIIKDKKLIFFELRYNNMLGLKNSTANQKIIQFVAGIGI